MAWELSVLRFVNQSLACSLLDALLTRVSLLTSPLPMLLVLFGVSWRRRREGTALLAVFVLSTLTSVALQVLLGRARPTGLRLVEPAPAFASFPSGHAAGAFALATLGALFWPRSGWLSFPGAGLVALSRVYLGHHFPTDVIAGGIVGAGFAATFYGLFCSPRGTGRPRWAWLLWGQAAVLLLASLSASLGLLHLRPLTLTGADKMLHFLLFGLLAFFAAAWWSARPAWQPAAALALLALAEEALQSALPGRSADPRDLLAGLVGIALFSWMLRRAAGRRLSGTAQLPQSTPGGDCGIPSGRHCPHP